MDATRCGSMHGQLSRKTTIEVWTETLGDSGERWIGRASIGAHSFRTENMLSRTGARVSALGLVMGHIACVHVRVGDDE